MKHLELQHAISAVFFPVESVPVVLSFDGPAMLASFGTTSVNASVSISKLLVSYPWHNVNLPLCSDAAAAM